MSRSGESFIIALLFTVLAEITHDPFWITVAVLAWTLELAYAIVYAGDWVRAFRRERKRKRENKQVVS